MSRWDKYAVDGPEKFSAKWDKYAIGDNWPALIGKSVAKGISSIANIPKLASQGLEAVYNAGTKMHGAPVGSYGMGLKSRKPDIIIDEDAPQTDYSSYIPDSHNIISGIKRNTGVDLEPYVTPRPTTSGQRIGSIAAEFVGPSMVTKLASKALTLPKVLGSVDNPRDFFKHLAFDTTLGGASGALQEADVNPLAADLLALGITRGGASAGAKAKDLFSRLTKNGRKRIAEKKVGDLLRNSAKNESLDNILNYGDTPIKWEIDPTTAEVAQNRGISNLHNAFAPNIPQIAEKQALNDSIVRKGLENIGDNLDVSATELGELGREAISKKLAQAEANRLNKTKNLYQKLEASEELYPTKNFSTYTNGAIEKEVGATESQLRAVANILPKKYAHKVKPLQDKLEALKKSNQSKIEEFKKSYEHLGPDAQKQLVSEYWATDKSLLEIQALEQELAKINNKYTPGHIDKTISEIGSRINKIKAGDDRKNKSLLRNFTQQKEALTKDLMSTPEGAQHRSEYAKHSVPVNAIERDKLLKHYIRKDEFNKYSIPEEKLSQSILKAPKDSIENYMAHIKGTKAEPATKAYFRNQYVGKAGETALPTYDKASQFLRNKKDKLQSIYTPEEYQNFVDVNNYLKNREAVNQAGGAAGSPTATRTAAIKDVEAQIGRKYPLGPMIETAAQIPVLKKVLHTPVGKSAANLVGSYTNPAYDVLEDILLNPHEAKRILTQPSKRPSNNFFNPALTQIINRQLHRGQ